MKLMFVGIGVAVLAVLILTFVVISHLKEDKRKEKKHTKLMSDALKDGSSAAGKAMANKRWHND